MRRLIGADAPEHRVHGPSPAFWQKLRDPRISPPIIPVVGGNLFPRHCRMWRALAVIAPSSRGAAASVTPVFAYGHVWSGRFTTIGVEVLLTTTQ
jgi:hypothetical protein